MSFAERLQGLRQSKGKNQKDFADLLNVQPSAYNKWEKGVNRPDNESLCSIAKSLNITTDYLLGMDDQPTREQSDVYALTGLVPEAVERLKEVWKGTHEPGTVPPVIRALNDLILQKDFGVLACIASFLYFDESGLPDAITVEYGGKTIQVPMRRQDVFRHGLLDALNGMLHQ